MPTPAAIAGLSKAGDYTYPQYSRTYTRVLSSGTATGITGSSGSATVSARPAAVQILGSSGVGLKKGELYTTDNTGAIYAWADSVTSAAKTTSTDRDVVAWAKGIFQALDDVKADSGTTTAQFMGRGSRILHAVATGTSVGDLVRQEYSTTASAGTTYPKNAFLSPIPINSTQGRGIINTIGTVIEIRSGNTKDKKYAATSDTDLAVVEIGGF